MDEDMLVVRRPNWHEDELELLCGIANAGGGRLVITSMDTTRRGGMRRLRKSFEAIPSLTQRELGLMCMTEPVMDGAQLCLEIVVQPADEPVSYRGNYYLYTNGENKAIEGVELERLLDRNATTEWEARVQPFIRQEDLDSAVVDNMMQLIDEEDLGDRRDSKTLAQMLEFYGIKNMQSNAFTNMGVLLLHRSPQNYIPGAYVRIGVFDAHGNEVSSAESITGPLTQQLRKTMSLLYTRYLMDAIEQQEAISDESTALPPQEAVKEALVNALVHKNYESNAPIKISIHPDRIYIDNVGRPPAGWTTEDLLGRHNSRPNNPSLAFSLQKSGLFNGWGNGIALMRRLCAEAGVPDPSFILRPDEMEVSFAIGVKTDAGEETAPAPVETPSPQAPPRENRGSGPRHAREDRSGESDGPEETSASKIKKPTPTGDRKPTFKERSIAAANRLDMTSTDEYILKVLETNGRVTAIRIAEVLGVSESTVRRSFRRLKDLGLIERIGSDKAGYWRVI